MKKFNWVLLGLTLASHAFANNPGPIPERTLVEIPDVGSTPYNPMTNYRPTQVSENRLMQIWNQMNTNVDGKDCYRRAHIWAYDMYDYYGVNSMKIFIHYTNKFNRVLDGTADESRRGIKDKIDRRIYNMLKYNKTWDYHVAPLVQLDSGDYRVLDKELIISYDARFPYTPDEAWDLKKRPASIDEWLEGLTIRGELLWKARKAMLERDMAKARSRNRVSTYQQLRAQYIDLGMDKYDQINIKCHKANSIADVDLNHSNAYCFYTIAPMYYYNEIDLRNLAFGYTGQNYAVPVRLDTYTAENFENGRSNYVQTKWNYSELKDARKELSRGRGDWMDRIRREQ
ncbi:MAG: hypothetical protein CME62_00260 [Halobacteriovoraceae bacterium]|nr:hypothetical protein [Halobacteriovoraceae bacterium]|tara:strand:+ start:11946 stop:12971 length:1026 start_codon:yes stop_codon:yes gene_type:complete